MREYILVMLIAAGATYLLSGLFRRVAVRIGAVAIPRGRDVHVKPVPYFGGLAMLCGVGMAFFVASRLPFLSSHAVVTRDSLGVFLAALVIAVVGAIDDFIDLPVIAKVTGQVVAAGVAVLNGVRLYWISLPGSIYALNTPTSILITVIFVFVVVNAINLVDGLDGLSSGVVGIGASAMFLYTYFLAFERSLSVCTTSSLITVVVTGVCLGFLPHNFHKARMFMGDSGSMLLGLLLACSTISFTGQIDSSLLITGDDGSWLPSWMPFLLPLAVMFVPLVDLVSSYIRRTMRGKWWFEADKEHLHHQLLGRGHSMVGTVVVLYLWTALFAYGATIMALVRQRWLIFVFAGAAVVLLLFTLRGKLRRTERTETGTGGNIPTDTEPPSVSGAA
ncbi:MAG: undecaprenyl/decaprenyl-phosphate alpha-N-acetylglucosaminyl 1-phosphate transferase [Propionibacteriaceae bacterium]|jgi:UDP-GlcNAc:undecaprenyl-phosphate GlcNAc-1-phosphate transferase|nr:undecaprenyl/decaprenyl-phosphate alpha-N-acetylglucosaminyl 1-phosphate transferase [Propionibacteriaceae bacterium]